LSFFTALIAKFSHGLMKQFSKQDHIHEKTIEIDYLRFYTIFVEVGNNTTDISC